MFSMENGCIPIAIDYRSAEQKLYVVCMSLLIWWIIQIDNIDWFVVIIFILCAINVFNETSVSLSDIDAELWATFWFQNF